MITETTITRLDKIIERMDAAHKAVAAAKSETANKAISTQFRLNAAMRTIKQIQARQAARR